MKHLIAVKKEFLEHIADHLNPMRKEQTFRSAYTKERTAIRIELAKYLTGKKEKE